MIQLYDYYRSSACYRVRIALQIKGLAYESINIDLFKGEQLSENYKSVNPQAVVPYYVDGGVQIGQSIAIIEYMDAKYPDSPLVYGSEEDKAYIRQLALLVACEMHPFSHPKVWKFYLPDRLGATPEQGKEWLNHWLGEGFRGYEGLLNKYGKSGVFSFGDKPSMADLCLVPQLYAARRNGLDLKADPKILQIEKNCIALKSFQAAAPESHPGAPADLEQIHGPRAPILAQAA
jgi:maleylacetoacetate isomerase